MPKLFVKNFVNIREAEIDVDKTLLVFTGETASGKSLLAKLLYLFQDLVSDFRQYVRRLHNTSPEALTEPGKDLHSIFYAQIARKFLDFFGDTALRPLSYHKANSPPDPDDADDADDEDDEDELPTPYPSFEIIYQYTAESRIRLTRTPEGILEIEIPAVMDEIQDIAYKLLEELQEINPEKFHTAKTGEDSDEDSDEKSASEFRYIFQLASGINAIIEKLSGTVHSRECLYIPADRSVAATYPDALKRIFYGGIKTKMYTRTFERSRANLEVMARFMQKNEEYLDLFGKHSFHSFYDERVKEEAENLDQPNFESFLKIVTALLNYDPEAPKDLSRIRAVTPPPPENPVDLESASTGQQTTIRVLQDMFLSLLYQDDILRVIEEPEAFLHPIAQRHFIHALALMKNKLDSQIILTTHSPYVLAVVKKLLTAGRLGKKDPEAAEAKTGIPQPCWLMHENVEVYEVKDGRLYSLLRPKNKSILLNPLADLLRDF